jgi:hypothetical protein
MESVNLIQLPCILLKFISETVLKTNQKPKFSGIFKSITGNGKKRHREKRGIVCATAKPSWIV